MIIAVFNKCYYIIYEKCLNVIVCEEMFLFKISLQITSDKFIYEGDLCFLHESQVVRCLWFKPHLCL